MAAPKTVYTYDLDGANRDFPIPFEYLTRKFIQVTLLGQDRLPLVLNIDYRFTQRTVITTTKAYGPADGYERIELRRYTSATERLVDFNDGSILKAYDLNTSQIQALHIAEEGRDVATDTIGVDNDGNLDARGRRIVNLADATEDGHAVTLRQEREWAASTLGNRNAAQASAVASEASAVRSDASRAESLRQAGLSKVSADASETSRLDAANSARIATEEIAKIDGQVLAAKGHADRSKSEAERSLSFAENSSIYATNSVNAATASINAKNAAAISAQNSAEAGLQLGMSMWGYRPQPFKGFVVDDGQELDRSVYPAFVALLDAGLLPTTDEGTWQANPWARGYFVAVSSPGKFRMRDLNGAQPGSYGGVFQRGDNGVVTQPGNRQWRPHIFRDQFQKHRFSTAHVASAEGSGSGRPAQMDPEFDMVTDKVLRQGLAGASWLAGYGPTTGRMLPDGANGTPRAGSETYPVHVTGAWMTRMFGVITPLGTAEANSLAGAYGSIASRMSTAEGRIATLEAPRSWGVYTGQRLVNTEYINTTGREISLSITWQQQGAAQCVLEIAAPTGGYIEVDWGQQQNVGGGGALQCSIPNGYRYRMTSTGNSIRAWNEYR